MTKKEVICNFNRETLEKIMTTKPDENYFKNMKDYFQGSAYFFANILDNIIRIVDRRSRDWETDEDLMNKIEEILKEEL